MSDHISTMSVFGLALEADRPVPGLLAADGAGGAPVRLHVGDEAAVDADWPAGEGAERLTELRHPDGSLFLAVDRSAAGAHRVHAPGYGTHVIDARAESLRSHLPDGDAWRWQRLLFAQVLPALAALRGIAVFHAAAVALDGRAIALTGPPGTGKTSTSTHLLAEGAQFVTDDVVCIAPGDGLRVEPGPWFASVHDHERDPLPPHKRARLGAEVGRSDKLHVQPEDPATRPTPLAAWCFLERGDAGTGVQIVPLDAPAPALLQSAYLPWAQPPARLRAQLDVSGQIAERVPVVRVVSPPSAGAADVAAAIRERFGGGRG